MRLAMISLHTNPLQQPGSGDAGGLNVYALHLGRELARLGCRVDIFTADPATRGQGRVQLAPGLRVHQIDLPGAPVTAKTEMAERLEQYAAELRDHSAIRSAQLIHAHYWLSAEVALDLGRDLDIPVAATMHTLGAAKNQAVGFDLEPIARLRAEERIAAEVDVLIANAQRDRRDHLHHLAADPDRVVVIRPGVDTRVFHPRQKADARARLGLEQEDLLALYVGRLQHIKGPDVGIRAMCALGARDPELAARTRLLVLGGASGEPEALKAAQRLASDCGVGERVRFHPPVAATDLAGWYAAADVLLVPSRSESFGLVALEAAASGLPVIGARVGGLSEAVTATGGVLVDGHDPVHWAVELRALLLDPERRREIGRVEAASAADHTWRQAAEATLACYRSTIRAHEDRGVLGGAPVRSGAWGV